MELPSQNIEAEESLIASVIINNSLMEDCEYLLPSDFYKTSHSIIFKSILEMHTKKEKIDLASLYYEINKTGLGEKIGGPEYLIKITENSPVFNTKKYTEIIKECSITRQTKEKCMSIIASQELGETLLSQAQSSLLSIKATTNTDEIRRLKHIIIEHLDRIERANLTEVGIYYKLGFPRIDRCLKTIGPKLIIIAGRPGAGKTALAVTIARNLDRQNVMVGFLSIEMPENEIIDRWLSMESGVDSSKFGKYKGFKDNDLQDINDAAAVLYDSEIRIDATGSLDIIDVERKCRKLKAEGCKVILIDQLSQIGNRQIKSGDLTNLYSENCTRIARLKKELGLPIFLLCQLNRDMKVRLSKEPILSDLKQSGMIEEHADAVLFIHRPEEYADDKDKIDLIGKTNLNLIKNRSGPKFKDKKIIFNHKLTYFYQGD